MKQSGQMTPHRTRHRVAVSRGHTQWGQSKSRGEQGPHTVRTVKESRWAGATHSEDSQRVAVSRGHTQWGQSSSRGEQGPHTVRTVKESRWAGATHSEDSQWVAVSRGHTQWGQSKSRGEQGPHTVRTVKESRWAGATHSEDSQRVAVSRGHTQWGQSKSRGEQGPHTVRTVKESRWAGATHSEDSQRVAVSRGHTQWGQSKSRGEQGPHTVRTVKESRWAGATHSEDSQRVAVSRGHTQWGQSKSRGEQGPHTVRTVKLKCGVKSVRKLFNSIGGNITTIVCMLSLAIRFVNAYFSFVSLASGVFHSLYHFFSYPALTAFCCVPFSLVSSPGWNKLYDFSICYTLEILRCNYVDTIHDTKPLIFSLGDKYIFSFCSSHTGRDCVLRLFPFPLKIEIYIKITLRVLACVKANWKNVG